MGPTNGRGCFPSRSRWPRAASPRPTSLPPWRSSCIATTPSASSPSSSSTASSARSGAGAGRGFPGTSRLRSSAEDIRTWGRLGLTGDWADKPIHVYGPPLQGAGAITYFQARVFGGGDLWNEDLREYHDRARMIAELARDPWGIAYS